MTRPDSILRETVTHYEPDDPFPPLMSQDELDALDRQGSRWAGIVTVPLIVWGFCADMWRVWRKR